jgi:integrase
VSKYDPTYWAQRRDELVPYHKAYHARRMAEDGAYAEKRRASNRAAAKRRRERIKAIFAEAKDRPCADCGRRYPPQIMEFDHVRGKKKINLAKVKGVVYASYSEIEEEIRKCEVRCPTCHRMRHYLIDPKFEDLRQARPENS